MADEIAALETRLACLEEMVALLFASEHLLSADPKQSLRRLEEFLASQTRGGDESEERAATVRDIIARVEDLQRQLPKKLVD